MQISMTMPVMEPDLGAVVLRDWARAIDNGPFASLCWGERMAFDNPETLTLMGALAAWTDRARLVTTVIVPQLHDPVMLAKALATGRMLCGGWLTVGIGVGGIDAMAPTTGFAGSEEELIAVLRKLEAVGADEIELIPTSSDLSQLRRVADVLAAI